MKKLWILGIVLLSLLMMPMAFSSLADDVVAYYKLDEESGTTASDATSNGNTGTASNSRIFTSNTGTSGIINSGADFTQGDDGINLGNVLFTEEHSFSAWIYINDYDGFASTIVGWTNTGINDQISLFEVDSNGKLKNIIRYGSNTATRTYVGSTTLSKNTWYHVTLSHIAFNDIKMYVNGIEETLTITSNQNPNPANADFNRLSIGVMDRPAGGSYFNGFIDEVGIWDRALSAEEVESLYDAQKDGFESGQYPEFGQTQNFAISVKEQYTLADLLNFTAFINGDEYTTTNGTIVTPFLSNESVIMNISIQKPNYFTRSFTNVNSISTPFNTFLVRQTPYFGNETGINVTDAFNSTVLNSAQLLISSTNYQTFTYSLTNTDYFTRTGTETLLSTFTKEMFPIGSINLTIRNSEDNSIITDNVTIVIENTNSQQTYNTITGSQLITGLVLNENYQLRLTASGYDTSFSSIQYNSFIESKTLYMQQNGTAVSVRVQDVEGKRLSGANVVIRSYVNGTLVEIQSKFTDVNGLSTFVLNTERTHLISVSKEEYQSLENLLIDFADTNIVVILDTDARQITPTAFDGITWSLTPFNFALDSAQLQNFTFSISATQSNLDQFSLSLYNGTNLISFTASQVASGGTVSISGVNVSQYQNIRAVGAFTVTDFPQQQIIRNFFITAIQNYDGSLLELRQRMKTELTEFQRLIIFALTFFVIMIVLSVFITGFVNVLMSLTLSVLMAWIIGMNMFFLVAIATILMIVLFAQTQER